MIKAGLLKGEVSLRFNYFAHNPDTLQTSSKKYAKFCIDGPRLCEHPSQSSH